MTDPEAAIFLYEQSGVMARPWADAGYECWCVDIAHSIRKPRREGNINYVWGDVRTWTPPANRRIVFVAAFSPCTHVSGSGARDHKTKGVMLLCDSLELFNAGIMACEWSGAPYCAENPVGVLSTHFRKPDYIFDPCDYGDPYTKKTCLWTGNGFVMPDKQRVEPVKGSMMHTLTPSDDRQRLRSQTPPGFAQAVFEANRPMRGATP